MSITDVTAVSTLTSPQANNGKGHAYGAGKNKGSDETETSQAQSGQTESSQTQSNQTQSGSQTADAPQAGAQQGTSPAAGSGANNSTSAPKAAPEARAAAAPSSRVAVSDAPPKADTESVVAAGIAAALASIENASEIDWRAAALEVQTDLGISRLIAGITEIRSVAPPIDGADIINPYAVDTADVTRQD